MMDVEAIGTMHPIVSGIAGIAIQKNVLFTTPTSA